MLTAVFSLLVGAFLFVLSMLFVPAVKEWLKGPAFLIPLAVFSLLGGVSVFLTLRSKIKDKPRKFLLLTGGSAAGFFIGVLLHNFLYAVEVLTSHLPLISQTFGLLHALFFLIATIVCPIGFLIGLTASIYLYLRMKTSKFSLPFIAFLQAVGLVVYCGLVGLLFWKGSDWFGKPPHLFLGPVMFLVLFVVSALISALIVLGYPFFLFWEKKKIKEALRLVVCTTLWIVFFFFLIVIALAVI